MNVKPKSILVERRRLQGNLEEPRSANMSIRSNDPIVALGMNGECTAD
jgi:hypothetical protein